MLEPWPAWRSAWVRLISSVMQGSKYGREGRGWKRRTAPRRSSRCERQRPHDDALREFDLELIVSRRFCVRECGLRRALEGDAIETRAHQDLLRRPGSPWFCGNPAECESLLPDRAAFDSQSRGGRDDGERVRSAFADL